MTRLAPAPTSRRPIARRGPRPDPVSAAVTVATAYVEVRSGRRGLPQLRDVLTRDAYRRARHAVVLRRRMARPCGGISISHVRAYRPTPDAVEVAVVVRDGDQVIAVAVRLDRRRGQWGVTDIGVPEDRAPNLDGPGPTGPVRPRDSA